MSLPDNIRSLFGAIPGAMPRGSAISAMAGPGFITGAEANQTHAQAGTRAGGWAEGVGSNATAVSSLAGTVHALGILAYSEAVHSVFALQAPFSAVYKIMLFLTLYIAHTRLILLCFLKNTPQR